MYSNTQVQKDRAIRPERLRDPDADEDRTHWVPMTLSEFKCALSHAMAIYGIAENKKREAINVIFLAIACNIHLKCIDLISYLQPICLILSVKTPECLSQSGLVNFKNVLVSEILVAHSTAEIFRPAHAVFLDRKDNKIVVSIR